ncbi:MAG: type V CRISPR-associated protein Cas12k [Limnoraphis robusta]
MNALEHLTTSIPSANDDGFEEEEEAFKKAMHQLFQRSKSLPFPVNYGSNLDLTWFKNNQGKICLKLNGLSKYPLEIRCHSRQYHWFKQFWEDWQLYEKFQNEIPAGLMTLCSARLIWQEGLNKGEPPWKANHLTLHCSLENLLWTQQGTEQCRAEKIMKTTNMIESFQNKLQENGRLTIDILPISKERGFSKPHGFGLLIH